MYGNFKLFPYDPQCSQSIVILAEILFSCNRVVRLDLISEQLELMAADGPTFAFKNPMLLVIAISRPSPGR